jgi:hypothetical protein
MPRVVVVLLFLALAVPTLSAQRRGGGGHFAMRGPSFGAHVGFGSGPHFSGRGFVGHGFVGRGFIGSGSFPVLRFHSRGFFAYPGIYGYPYYGYPYYDTLGFGYSSYNSVNDDAAYRQNQQLSQQLYDLDSQVRELRDQNDQLRYDLERRRYRGDDQPRPAPIPQGSQSTPQSSQVTPELPPAVFVFKDGVRLDAHSYAIVGQTLWILSPQRALKYPVAQLDVDATKKANADRGLELTLPSPVNAPVKPQSNPPSALHGD